MCRPGPPKAVIFDLDGTLVQTRLASWEVFRSVDTEFDLGVRTAERFYELFGTNLFTALRGLCRDDAQAAAVERAFMERLRTEYSPAMIPGMSDVVRALAPHCTLAVLSSNATAVLRRVLLSNDLAYCFAHAFGGDVEPDKQRGIQRFLADAAQGSGRRCEVFYDESQPACRCDNGSTVLVTDTVGDVRAATAAGIRAIGVAWGMHTQDELLDAGCEFVAIWPQELLANLLDGAPAVFRACPAGESSVSELPVLRAGRIRRQRRAQLGERVRETAHRDAAAEVTLVCDGGVDPELSAAMRRMLG